jgi:hypothetical protein
LSQDKGFDILGVSIGTDKKWLDAMRKDSIAWASVCDLKEDANKAALIMACIIIQPTFLLTRRGQLLQKT